MSKQNSSRERGREGSRADSMGAHAEGKRTGAGLSAGEQAVSRYSKTIKTVYGLLRQKQQAGHGGNNSVESTERQLQEEALKAGAGDSRSVLWELFCARKRLLQIGLRAERLRANQALARELSRKCRAEEALKPYSLALIKLYTECVSSLPLGPTIVSMFLQEWFDGAMRSPSLEDWLDPLDEAWDKEELDQLPSGNNKKDERVLIRIRELLALQNQLDKRLGKNAYFEKAAVGISRNILQIAEQKQHEAEVLRQNSRASESAKEDEAVQHREQRNKAYEFLERKLSSQPLGSDERIQALLDITSASEKELKEFMLQESKPQQAEERQAKDKDRTKAKPLEIQMFDQLIKAVQQARESGSWLHWSATPPSQLQGDEEVTEQELSQPQEEGSRAQGFGTGKGGKGKASKVGAAGTSRAGSSKGGEAKQGAGEPVEGPEEQPRRLFDVRDWLQLLNRDVARQSYTAGSALPLPDTAAAPGLAELWTGAALLPSLSGTDDVASEPGSSPASILESYQMQLDTVAGLLMPGGHMVATDSGSLEVEESEAARRSRLLWTRRKDQAVGFGALLESRGLKADPFPPFSTCLTPTGLQVVWSAESLDQFQESWEHEDYQGTVRAVVGDVLPDSLFAPQGGPIKVSPAMQAGLECLGKQRSDEAARHVAVAGSAVAQGLLLAYDEADDDLLGAQLRLDVMDGIRLLREALLLTPLLQQTLRQFLAACGRLHGQSLNVHLSNSMAGNAQVAQALSFVPFDQLKELRSFILAELGMRHEALLTTQQAAAALILAAYECCGADLKAPALRNSIPPLRMSREALSSVTTMSTIYAHNQAVNTAVEQYEELGMGADCCLLPMARWPSLPDSPVLGTPEAEKALVDFLFSDTPWFIGEGARPPSFKYVDLQRLLNYATYASAQAAGMCDMAQQAQQQLSQPPGDNGSPWRLKKLEEMTKKIRGNRVEAFKQYHEARCEEIGSQLETTKKILEAVEAKLEAFNSRPKVKDKKGAQVQADKRDDALHQQQIAELEGEKQRLTDDAIWLNAMQDTCRQQVMQLRRQDVNGLSNGFSSVLSPPGFDDEELEQVALRELSRERQACAEAAQTLAMLAEACLVNAHLVAANMTLQAPYCQSNLHCNRFPRLWRFTLLERMKDDDRNALIKAEEEAKAKTKTEAKKKEGSKANKKSAKVLVAKAASEDEEEEVVPARQAPPPQPVDQWQAPELKLVDLPERERPSVGAASGWGMDGAVVASDNGAWKGFDAELVQREVTAQVLEELGLTHEDQLYDVEGAFDKVLQRMEEARKAYDEQPGPAASELPLPTPPPPPVQQQMRVQQHMRPEQQQQQQQQQWQDQRQQEQQLGRNRQSRSGAITSAGSSNCQQALQPRTGSNRDDRDRMKDKAGREHHISNGWDAETGPGEASEDAAPAAMTAAAATASASQRKGGKEHVHARKRPDGTWEMIEVADMPPAGSPALSSASSAPQHPSLTSAGAPRIPSGALQASASAGATQDQSAGSAAASTSGVGGQAADEAGKSGGKRNRNKKKEERAGDGLAQQWQAAAPCEPKAAVPGMWSDEEKPSAGQARRGKGKARQGQQGPGPGQGPQGKQGGDTQQGRQTHEQQQQQQQQAGSRNGTKLAPPTAVGHSWPPPASDNGHQYDHKTWSQEQAGPEQGYGFGHGGPPSGWYDHQPELGPPALPSEQLDDFFNQPYQHQQQHHRQAQVQWQQQQQQQQQRGLLRQEREEQELQQRRWEREHQQQQEQDEGQGGYGPSVQQLPLNNPWHQQQVGGRFPGDASSAAEAGWQQQSTHNGHDRQAQDAALEQPRGKSEGWGGRQGGSLGVFQGLRHGALPSVPDPNLAPYAAPFGFGAPAPSQHPNGVPFYGGENQPGPGEPFYSKEAGSGKDARAGHVYHGEVHHGDLGAPFHNERLRGPYSTDTAGGPPTAGAYDRSGARVGSGGMLPDWHGHGPGGPFFGPPGEAFRRESSDRQAVPSADRPMGRAADARGEGQEEAGVAQAPPPYQQQPGGRGMPLPGSHGGLPHMLPPYMGVRPASAGAPGPGAQGMAPGPPQGPSSGPQPSAGAQPSLPPHLLAANLAANLAASGVHARPPVLRPPLVQPGIRATLPLQQPYGMGGGPPGSLGQPLQPPHMGFVPPFPPAGQLGPGSGPQQPKASISEDEEDDSDEDVDLLTLCGVAAPVPQQSQPQAVPTSIAHGTGAAQPTMPQFSPPLIGASSGSGGGTGAAGPTPHMPPGMAPWQAQAQLQQQQQSLQAPTPTSSSGSATTAVWGSKPPAAFVTASQMELDNDPGPAGFVGVVDEEEYPVLGGMPAPSRQQAAPKSWAKLVSKAPPGRAQGAAGQDNTASTATSGAVQDDDEDEELQRVLQESKMTAASSGRAPAGTGAGAEPRHEQQSQSVATGLVNRQGEYNCFLNVIIQCLWHCVAFRRVIEQQHPDNFQGQPVVHSLALLFRALSNSEQQHANGGQRTAVDPTQLREALDVLPNHNFRIGEMNDPSEVLTAIYECLTKSPQLRTPNNASRVDQVFGLQLSEQLDCRACGKVSHIIKPHIEYFHIVQATALRNMAVVGGGNMATMLKELESQNQKKCDRDLGGCDHPGTPARSLGNKPQVFTLLIAWEEQVSGEDVKQTLDAVDTELMLKEVYDICRLVDVYRLHSMFCYYGQHYHAFICKEEVQQWLMFDDAHVASVGSWQDVIHKCVTGRLQPLVLFYQIRH